MDANLKQKYDATLADFGDYPVYRHLTELAEAHNYKFQFSNDSTGFYCIQWDKNTSEPFIVEPPTPHTPPTVKELNQNAEK